jgi:HEAT repeat protein
MFAILILCILAGTVAVFIVYKLQSPGAGITLLDPPMLEKQPTGPTGDAGQDTSDLANSEFRKTPPAPPGKPEPAPSEDAEDVQAVQRLIEELGDKDVDVRLGAYRTLKAQTDAPTVQLLIQALKSENLNIELTASELLLAGGEEAAGPLITALKDTHWKVRWRAAETLGRMRYKESIDPLVRALTDEDELVRGMAARSLLLIGGRRAADALVRALNDPSHKVRFEVALALRQLDPARDPEPLIMDALVQALSFSQTYQRMEAVKALGDMSGEHARSALIQALNDKDSRVRLEAVLMLGQKRDLSLVEPLSKRLQDEDPSIGAASEAVLKKMAEERGKRPAPEQTLQELALRLGVVGRDLTSWRLADGDELYERLDSEAKSIGQELHRRGGMDLMLQAFEMAHAPHVIEIIWSGIGDWMG